MSAGAKKGFSCSPGLRLSLPEPCEENQIDWCTPVSFSARMSMGITLCEADGQPELPDQYSGHCYFQNMGEDGEVLETMKEMGISKLKDLVNWDFTEGEESSPHPAATILEEAEKVKAWLDANKKWDQFDYGREGFMQDLDEMLTVLRFAASENYMLTLDYC